MAILLHNHLFLATPRTASNALFHCLRGAGGVDLGDHHDIPDHVPGGVRVVACVRNHYDWFVSSWIKATWRSNVKELQQMPFENWLRRVHEPGSPLSRFTFPGYVEPGNNNGELYAPLWSRCHALLRYEAIEDELKSLLGDDCPLPQRINTTPHKKDYRLYYNEPLREFVHKWYGNELAELGYNFDNGRAWEPRDDTVPLTGGGLFDANNVRRTGLREYHDWPNLENNPK